MPTPITFSPSNASCIIDVPFPSLPPSLLAVESKQTILSIIATTKLYDVSVAFVGLMAMANE